MTGLPAERGGGPIIGRVAEVWRYPVKSIGGELLSRARCERRGLQGDRRWAVLGEDGKIGSGKSTRRFRRMPGLLSLVGSSDERGDVWIGFPDGRQGRADDPETAKRVSEVVGEPVHLDTEDDVSFFDDGPVHLVTTVDLASLQASIAGRMHMDRRRFRPNVLIESGDTLVRGSRYLVGDTAILGVTGATVRCVMVTMVQPGLEFAPKILKHLERQQKGELGVYADVVEPGEIAVGDPVTALT